MKISVIVLTYNHEKHIAQALDSVLVQETNFDYEIIIAEDCSTDRTRSIVLDFQRRNPDKIRLVLPAKNLGCHGNRVFAQAFELAQGQYVALLDGDDYWTSPTKLQKQADFLDAHPEYALCSHNALRIYEDENRAPFPQNFAGQKRISALEDIWEQNFVAYCTPMFRTDVLETIPECYYDQLPLKEHPVWAFPDRSPKQTQQHLASGACGSAEAPWIGGASVYEFWLYGGAAQDNLLASVTVRQNGIAFDSPPPDREPSKNGAFITAWPNPVPAGTKPGKTTISWSTHDGSKGVIRLLMKSHRIKYPPDRREAIEQLETLRAKGGEFLLIRRELVSWLEDYKGLKEHLDRQYRIIQDDEVCRIYDLRGTN